MGDNFGIDQSVSIESLQAKLPISVYRNNFFLSLSRTEFVRFGLGSDAWLAILVVVSRIWFYTAHTIDRTNGASHAQWKNIKINFEQREVSEASKNVEQMPYPSPIDSQLSTQYFVYECMFCVKHIPSLSIRFVCMEFISLWLCLCERCTCEAKANLPSIVYSSYIPRLGFSCVYLS